MTKSHEPVRIPVENTFNFRDLGGWLTPQGEVHTGRLFRSDGLAALTRQSHAQVTELGITTVIDLREEREVQVAPDHLGTLEIEHTLLPLFANRLYPVDRDRTDRINRKAITLPQLYAIAVDDFGTRIAEVLNTIADKDGPVLFHCSAGKDRTGIIASFIHELVGVSRYDTVTDYNATERFLGADFLAAISANFANAGIVANLSQTATEAPREYMDDLLAKVDAEHGCVEKYLLKHGLDTATAQKLRQRLLNA